MAKETNTTDEKQEKAMGMVKAWIDAQLAVMRGRVYELCKKECKASHFGDHVLDHANRACLAASANSGDSLTTAAAAYEWPSNIIKDDQLPDSILKRDWPLSKLKQHFEFVKDMRFELAVGAPGSTADSANVPGATEATVPTTASTTVSDATDGATISDTVKDSSPCYTIGDVL